MIVAAAPSASSQIAAHFWHGVAAVTFVVIAVGGTALGERRASRKRERGESEATRATPRTAFAAAVRGLAVRRGGELLTLAALGCAAAASVHVVVMPEHFKEATLYGAFFLVTALAQYGYAALLLTRPSRPLLISGTVANTTIVGLWLVTRLVAIPLGPAAGSRESFGGLDILASGFEVLFVTLASVPLMCRPLPTPRRLGQALLAPAAAGFGAVALVGIALTTYLAPPS